MRLVVQRVKSAQVQVGDRVVGAVGKGLCVLVGIAPGDGDREIEWATNSLASTKYWPDTSGAPWKVSLNSSDYEVILVSQFTLYAKVYKKGRLDFHHAMAPTEARVVFHRLVA